MVWFSLGKWAMVFDLWFKKNRFFYIRRNNFKKRLDFRINFLLTQY